MKNKEIGTRLKSLRKNKGLEQQEVAKLMGYKSDTTISKWENGKNLPNGGKLAKLASIFNTSTDYILHGEAIQSSNSEPILDIYNELTPPRQQKVYHYAEEQLDEQRVEESGVVYHIDDYKAKVEEDLYGKVSAGSGYYVYDNPVETVEIPRHIIPDKPYDIMLEVAGDSMEPLFRDGEYIFVKKSPDIRSGSFGVFIINGESYVKKVYVDATSMRLVSLNKAYNDIIVTENDDIITIGKVVL
ncbi:helix-turn-helix domain-containing protein [Dolosigranulum pigrum]|uniref:helix-turn-helix domain-containing protein n=1 Tax=Dolosigranulum pigrum TaxID=29394 RepID=UPI00248C0035|nr:S24 family peptidase [Dolosigranulum pigrum]